MAFATVGGFLRKVAAAGQGLGALVVTTDSTDPLSVETARAATAADPSGAVTLTTSSATVKAANTDRVGIYICNTHATNDVYLALGATAVTAEGIYLKAAGGACYINDYTGVIAGIASGASTVVTFSEV